eukprot:bmy_10771T0
MANMDSDSSHLLIPEVDNEINPGPMNIQFDSSDIRSKSGSLTVLRVELEQCEIYHMRNLSLSFKVAIREDNEMNLVAVKIMFRFKYKNFKNCFGLKDNVLDLLIILLDLGSN